MIKILADQNFNGRILKGLKSRILEIDCITTHEIGIQKYSDYDLLTFAARESHNSYSRRENIPDICV